MKRKKKGAGAGAKPSSHDRVASGSESGQSAPAESRGHRQVREALKLNPNYFLFFLLIIVFIGCYNILRPYIHTIILAFILATLCQPIHIRIVRLFGGRKNRAAVVSCILITLVVVLPLFFTLIALIQQGVQSFNAIYAWVAAGNYAKVIEHPLLLKVVAGVKGYLPDIHRFFPDVELQALNLEKIVLSTTSAVGKALLNQSGHLASNVTSFVGKFFLMLFTFFFFVRDEEKIVQAILYLIPLSASQEEMIITKVKTVAKSALLGTLVTALAQGLAGGVAFWFVGLPGFFWGMVMAFASLVPLIGTALIWVPAAIYLFAAGHWKEGILLVLWCVVVVGMLDNLVRPLFMQESAAMSTMLIFFALLGGINYFGLIGILYGPLIFGLAMVLLYIYKVEFGDFLTYQDNR